jgi:hypothetical protein
MRPTSIRSSTARRDDRVPQAAQADRAPDPRGDRDLRHGPARRPLAGLPLGRQGQLHAARGTDELQWRGLLPVDLLACNLDQGQPGFPATVLPEFLTRMGVPHRIEYRDTYSVVIDKVPGHKTYCALCSRLRRGHLYRIAREEGCSAVVLGHHRDDIIETFLLNLFHGGKLAAMPPKLLNDEGDLYVHRPLAHVSEADCARFARAMGYPIIPCDLCGSQDGLQRASRSSAWSTSGSAAARAAGRSSSAR